MLYRKPNQISKNMLNRYFKLCFLPLGSQIVGARRRRIFPTSRSY